MFIHHATAARAARLGLSIAIEGEQAIVRCGDVIIAAAESGKAALASAEQELEISGHEDFADLAADLSEAAEEEGEDEAPRSNLAKQVAKYRGKYAAVSIGAGRENCGDTLAVAMLDVHGDLLWQVASANGLDFGRWAHLNPGHAKMCLTNRLRGMARKGEQVLVLGQGIEG